MRTQYFKKYFLFKKNKINYYTFNSINCIKTELSKRITYHYIWILLSIKKNNMIFSELKKLVILNKKMKFHFFQLKKYNNIYYSFYKNNPKMLKI